MEAASLPILAERTGEAVRWAKLIDHTRCIGCHACTTACKSENEVPLSVTRTYVKYVDVGQFPETRRAYQVTRCNQCADAPCVAACPTAAMYRRDDGIVDFDKSACIGCKACIAACPYDAIFINPTDHSAEKCNFCAHRLDVGLEPACVTVCPTQAILVGDLNDPTSPVTKAVNRDVVSVRRPEKETQPKLFYKGAHQATLDPLAAKRPRGGLFMWSEQGSVKHQVPSGHPGEGNSSAAAVLSYDVPHRAPWDWRVSLYTWTKGIAAGVYLVPALLALLGWLLGFPGTAAVWADPVWLWATPVVGGAFLALTGALLVWDLEHPERFYFLFTRPQWRSWLVRGGLLISGYGAVLVVHFGASVVGSRTLQPWLAAVGVPLAAGTAIYTAYLFAQAKARDLWQNPLAPIHLLVQAVLLGAAALLLGGSLASSEFPFDVVVAGTSALHLLLVFGEHTLSHVTAHAHMAAREMTRGRYAGYFWVATALVAVAVATPWLGSVGALGGLVGLLAHEHAYVQAGQSVPLA
jgi:Fe-S-cluster-containing dehydrogenase component/formate-dependent nitrite reductase membrane component NrfD